MNGNANESQEKVNPNVNCLEGKQCPKCGSYGPFEVVVSMRVMLCDDGSGDADDGAIEYDDDAPATCYVCRYMAKFGAFDVR
jgi:hypothetical protein